VIFYFTGTEFLYDYNAKLSKAVAAKRLPLTILWMRNSEHIGGNSPLFQGKFSALEHILE